MGRPRKAAMINAEPFDADATIDGHAIKQVARERRFDAEENPFKTIKSLRELLQSAITIKNYPVQQFKSLSQEPSDWGVAYYFPVAKDDSGKVVATYVDEPKSDRQIKLCAKKSEVMEKLGLRYLVFRHESLISSEMLSQQMASGESMINEGQIVSL